MKTLRGKLFVSVGAIFLVVAFLGYLIPEILVRRDLNKASVVLKQHFDTIQKQIPEISSFLISYRFIENAVDLEVVSKLVSTDLENSQAIEKSSWNLAAKTASYNPNITFVQVQKEANETALVLSQNTHLYTPFYISVEKEMLWVKIPEKDETFIAIWDKDDLYLLFEATSLKKLPKKLTQNQNTFLYEMLFQASNLSPATFSSSPSSQLKRTREQVYRSLLSEEMAWVTKIELIQSLASWKGKETPLPLAGIFKKSDPSEQSVCILSREAFQSTPLAAHKNSNTPFLLSRTQTQDLDLVNTLSLPHDFGEMDIGFSLSTIVKKIASLLQKTVIVTNKTTFSMGFSPSGESFNIDLPSLNTKKTFVWNGKEYVPYQIDLEKLTLVVLIPEVEITAVSRFLGKIKEGLIEKITISLVAASLLSLILALLLLEKTSKKITQPITQLATAADELSKGNYEEIHLPSPEKQSEEVAALSHSFKNMVGALKDREKVRGVLNKVVSKEVAEEILNTQIELGGEERILTILFSDIRGFTRLSEHIPPRELIGLLNDYMTTMCKVIDETKGVVDKFVGDEIMALYGAPLFLQAHANHAVDAAVKMILQLRKWNEEQKKKGSQTLEIGIGIHTGVALSGNMGATNRLNYTVVGANVNLASRLCSKAAPMQILISEETYKALGENPPFTFKPLEPVTLKGIDHPVPIYEVVV